MLYELIAGRSPFRREQEALRNFEKAARVDPSMTTPAYLRAEPIFAPLRGRPRFAALPESYAAN
jgi:hypothetical protein